MISTILVVSCLTVVVEFLVRKIPNVYGYKFEEITKNDKHYKTLILGSSHSFFGINPDYLSDPSFNAANVSQDFKYDSYVLEKSLDALSEMEVVILPVSVFSLFQDMDSGIEFWRKYNYSIWFGYDDIAIEQTFNIKTYSILFSAPSKTHLLESVVQNYITGNFEPTWSKSGWGTEFSDVATEKALIDSGKTAAARHQKKPQLNEQNLNYLREIVNICKERNLRLLMVTLPAYGTYRKYLNEERLNEIISIVNGLSNSSDNVKYLNYLNDDRFVKSDYRDADHLNHDGAKKFTRILNQALQDWTTYQPRD